MSDTARSPDRSGLDRLAYAQEGYFTAAQTAVGGFSAQLLDHHTHTGPFQASTRERAVVSPESALELHGLSDVIADRFHLTVPRKARGIRAPTRRGAAHPDQPALRR